MKKPVHKDMHFAPPYSDLHIVNEYPPHMHSDIHEAHYARPGEPCCPEKPDDCECVTSADIEKWNQITALSGLTAVSSLSSLSALDEITSSAGLWNSNYTTVDSNSASWTSAFASLSGIEALIAELSAKIPEVKDIQFNSKSISGDGSKTAPYGVAEYDNYINLIKKLVAFSGTFYNKDGTQKWMDTAQGASISAEINTLRTANTKEEGLLAEHDEEIKYLLNNIKSKADWKFEGTTTKLTPEKVSELTGTGIVYYTYNG